MVARVALALGLLRLRLRAQAEDDARVCAACTAVACDFYLRLRMERGGEVGVCGEAVVVRGHGDAAHVCCEVLRAVSVLNRTTREKGGPRG